MQPVPQHRLFIIVAIEFVGRHFCLCRIWQVVIDHYRSAVVSFSVHIFNPLRMRKV